MQADELRRLLSRATEGPWRWLGEPGRRDSIPKHPYLRSDVSPRYIVMDFVRQGMQGAEPRFRSSPDDWSIMQPVSELGPGWERHPDAELIAAAPEIGRTCLSALDTLSRVRALVAEWALQDAPIQNGSFVSRAACAEELSRILDGEVG